MSTYLVVLRLLPHDSNKEHVRKSRWSFKVCNNKHGDKVSIKFNLAITAEK